MALFNVPTRNDKKSDLSLAKKTTAKPKQSAVRVGNNLIDRIATAKAVVEKKLGKYKDDYIVINSVDELHDYMTKCIDNGVISIDTETTGLDPILDKIVGLCLYSPNLQAAYVPINHKSYVTGARSTGQLTEQEVGDELKILETANIDIIMFNAKFDIRVIRNQLNVYLTCTWDCYLAARLMNENEPSNALKKLHSKYVLNGEDEFTFEELFNGLTFDKIPVNVAYIYAAHDAIITYELYEFQKKYLYYEPNCSNDDRNGMNGVAWVFFNIEMPCVKVVCDMEDNGVLFDMNYAHELSEKYNKAMQEKSDKFYSLCEDYKTEIENFRLNNPNAKIDNPINIASPTQIAILLYDILEIEPPDPKSPRGTGEAILQKIDNPIAKAILDYREMSKLVSTYIDKLPNCVNPKDGRIHCSFNQYGADTGRFSSSDPNLQNIPSHNKDIRKMFVATNEEKLVSTDTQQFVVDRWCEVECADKWKYADKIVVGDELLLDDGSCVNVCEVTVTQDKVVIDFT